MKFVALALQRTSSALNGTRALSTMSAALRHGSFCSCSNCSRMFLVRNKRSFGFGSFFSSSSASNPPKGAEETGTTQSSSGSTNEAEAGTAQDSSKEFIEMKKSLVEKDEKIKTLTASLNITFSSV